MNYNAKHGDGAPGVRRIQRVSDTKSMGYTVPSVQPPYASNTFAPDASQSQFNYNDQSQINPNPNTTFGVPNQVNYAPNVQNVQNVPIAPNLAMQQSNPYYDPYSNAGANVSNYGNQQPAQFPQPNQPTGTGGPAVFDPTSNVPPNSFNTNFSMLQQPMVQDMALQYGQRLADQGKQLVETQFEKYIPVTRLKYYFAVDNNYVVKKMILLLFPFTHRDWSLKYDQDNPVQPRYDLNAPDLYIPTMAYITFVVLAGLVMGMQNQFTPEQLGVISSSALAYSLFELIVYSIILYISNIATTMKTLDLLAFSGYKFVTINLCILVSIIFKRFGYYLTLIYTSFTLCFFLLRTLKAKILRDSTTGTATYDAYGNVQQADVHADYSTGRKRKLYFLLLISFVQPILSFFLSMHLIPTTKVVEATPTI